MLQASLGDRSHSLRFVAEASKIASLTGILRAFLVANVEQAMCLAGLLGHDFVLLLLLPDEVNLLLA